MDFGVIIAIGIIAGMVCYGVLTLVWILNGIFTETEDFDDVCIPETFNLPLILFEIEEIEKAATRSNE